MAPVSSTLDSKEVFFFICLIREIIGIHIYSTSRLLHLKRHKGDFKIKKVDAAFVTRQVRRMRGGCVPALQRTFEGGPASLAFVHWFIRRLHIIFFLPFLGVECPT